MNKVFPFQIGQVVYLRTRAERVPGTVRVLLISASECMYEVCWSDGSVGTYYAHELSSEYVADYEVEQFDPEMN